MSKLYAHNKLATLDSSISFGGGRGSGRSNNHTSGPGGGSDPGNTRDSRVDEGGLRYRTDDQKRFDKNVATVASGGAAIFGTGTLRVAGGVASVVNNLDYK